LPYIFIFYIFNGYKKSLYEKFGVKEYWTADPGNKTVCVSFLKDGRYVSRLYSESESIKAHAFPGFEVALPQIFEDLFVE